MSRRPCIVHVGMYKTGTTSIQRTLSSQLRDSRFLLVTRDAVWGNLTLGAMFLAHASDLPLFRSRHLAGSRLERFRRRRALALEHSLQRARRSRVTPILSAEIIWRMNREDARRLDRFLCDQGFEARIVACLRAPCDFLASGFQEIVKTGVADWATILDRLPPLLDYRGTVAMLDDVFGRERVDAYVFDPAHFAGRCAVQAFCRRIGCEVPSDRVVRVNESMNANVLRFLYSYNRHARTATAGVRNRLLRGSLLHRLRDLSGPRLRVNPDIVPWLAERHREDGPWLEERLGRPLPWSLESETGARSETVAGAGEAQQMLNGEPDLDDFAPAALEWLARRTRQPHLPVSEQLHRLNRWPHPSIVAHLAQQTLTSLKRR